MSRKILLKFLGGCLLVLMTFMFVGANLAKADAISGVVNSPASQLIVPYDERDFRHTHVQVTNTDVTESVTVHIQLLDSVGCVELDKFDTFTPQDTHLYSLDGLFSNSSFSDLGIAGSDRSGFGIMVITPVNLGLADPTPIAFNNLHGTVSIYQDQVDPVLDNAYRFNAPGRLAVDASGTPLEDGTFLNGETEGYEDVTPS